MTLTRTLPPPGGGPAADHAEAPAHGARPPLWPAGWPAHWPITVALFGFPIWWVLGLSVIVPFGLTIVMVVHLHRRRRTLRVPPGFGFWLLFLVWVLVGAALLWAQAPDAMPNHGLHPLGGYLYRVMSYVAATIVLLWVGNLDEDELPSTKVRAAFGFMFVVTVAGGWLGYLLPSVDFPSALELLLPHGLRSNGLVQNFVHPNFAENQQVLGYSEARPAAPFAYSNSWGSNLAFFVPYFLVSWWHDGRLWQKLALPLILAAAGLPIVASLNRGLWISLIVGFFVAVFLAAVRRHYTAVAGLLAIAGLAAAAFFMSPLWGTVQERIAHPHSNERRGELMTTSVSSVAHGSPIVGFGSSRDVRGTFFSIAGGDTTECPACAPPPLGTQGQLWMVSFSEGLVGAALFLAFMAVWLARTWRASTVSEGLGFAIVMLLVVMLPVYDTLGLPMITIMAAVGMAWRAQQADGRVRDPLTLGQLNDAIRRSALVLLVLAIGGTVVGAAFAYSRPRTFTATTYVLTRPTPVGVNTTQLIGPEGPEISTVDTEAARVIADSTLSRALGTTDPAELERLRKATTITAPTNTTVLRIGVSGNDKSTAQAESRSVAAAYVTERVEQLRAVLARPLQKSLKQQGFLAPPPPRASAPVPIAGFRRASYREGMQQFQQRWSDAVQTALGTPRVPAEVIREGDAVRDRRPLSVPVISGLALGILAGAGVVAVRLRRQRRLVRGRADA